MRLLLAAGIGLGLLVPASASADVKTFGTDLSRAATSTRTCETGFFDPALIAGTGFPYRPYASCTWWSAGGLQGTGTAIVPYGGGTVRKVRVKVGPVTGRMQVVALRSMRHPGSLADPACCFPSGSGPVFTPNANATTELDVDIPVKHETDRATGVVNYDVLALSVLDAGVPMPAEATSDGGWGGIVAGMFPAYVPGEERLAGYGSVMPGHVLLAADIDQGTTTPPPPPPPDATIGSGRATIRAGAVRLKVTCHAAARCDGQVVVARRGSVYGRARIAMAPGTTRGVRVALSRSARRTLNRLRKASTLATVRIGGRTVARRRLILSAAARRA